MMVPLTDSLYAPGKVGSTDSVLLDIGTGYFVEYSPADGADYCKRKVLLLRENVEKLGEVRAGGGGGRTAERTADAEPDYCREAAADAPSAGCSASCCAESSCSWGLTR